jgi:predicted esterase
MSQPLPNIRLLLVLALVAAVELGLFAECHYLRWQQYVRPLNQPPEVIGEGLVIHNNGLGYYAWLRSLLIDHDWDFDNEFDEHAVPGEYVPPPTYRTESGRRANQWSVGPACVWAWTIVPGHLLLRISGLPWEPNGYSLPYQILVGITSLLVSWTGLLLLYGVCKHYARPQRAALAVALTTLGSTIVYYGAVEVTMAHGIGTAVLTALIWYWQKTYGSVQPRRWLVVGVLVGATALIRWQLATFALLPVGEVLLSGRRGENNFRKLAVGLTLAALGALLAFLPQMIAWRYVYGHWLASPVPQVAHHWLHPSLWQTLFSQDRSLFYWTPISLLACAGAVALAFRPKQGPAWVLLAAFALQVYVLASMWGKGEFLPHIGNHAGAFLAQAYGMRHLTESLVALAPGLAFLLERASGWRFRLIAGLSFVLVFWNLLLVLQYTYGLIPPDAGLGPQELAAKTWQFTQDDTVTCLLLAEVLGLLWLLLTWGQQTPAGESAKDSGENHSEGSPLPGPSLAPRTKKMLGLSGLVVLVCFLGYLVLPEKHVGFLQRIHRDRDGREWKYTLFVPLEYKGERPYPLLVYLHGFGARGVDGSKPMTGGPGPFIKDAELTFEMLALFPQSETGYWEADTGDGQRAMAIMEDVIREYVVDRQCICLTGTSRGGFGVWSLAAHYPHQWAAIVPICGGGDPASAAAIKHLPCWCFHGTRDEVIDVRQSRQMIAALQAAGANPRFTEYPDVGHACGGRAYATPELWQWLRSQRLEPAPVTDFTSRPMTPISR